MDKHNLKTVISFLKDYVLHNRVVYKDYLGDGEYKIKKLPADLLPDSLQEEMSVIVEDIETAKTIAGEAKNTSEALKINPVFTGTFSQNRNTSVPIGDYSHAEGDNTAAVGECSHAEGRSVKYYARISGESGAREYTVNEGLINLMRVGQIIVYEDIVTTITALTDKIQTAITLSSDTDLNNAAVEVYTAASGDYSHVEGVGSSAAGTASHAEGENTVASGDYSHAEGTNSSAWGDCSHVEGKNNYALGECQHVQGKNCLTDKDGKYAHIVGNGIYDTGRSNAHTLDWDGVPWFQGRPQFGGNSQDNGSQTVMANGDKEIVIASSTTNSAKKFKITVDDNGTISATLVE